MRSVYSAIEATGYGRTDWCLRGPCPDCVPEEDDCHRCDGYGYVILKMGLTERQAKQMAEERNAQQCKTLLR